MRPASVAVIDVPFRKIGLYPDFGKSVGAQTILTRLSR